MINFNEFRAAIKAAHAQTARILTTNQAKEVIDAMSSPMTVSFDFRVAGSSSEKVVVHEREGEVLVWMQCHGFTHNDERYSSRADFVRAYALGFDA